MSAADRHDECPLAPLVVKWDGGNLALLCRSCYRIVGYMPPGWHGQPPRPERVVKAEALREYAAEIRETAGVHLRTAPLVAKAHDMAVALDIRAERIEATR